MELEDIFNRLEDREKLRIYGVSSKWARENMIPLTTSTPPQSYEDCFKKVLPGYYVSATNAITSLDMSRVTNGLSYAVSAHNNVPTQKCAQQLQAAAKLFVIQHALQGEWVPDLGDWVYEVYYSRRRKVLDTTVNQCGIHSPFQFRTEDLSKHALQIAEPIWLQYFGV